MKIFKRMVGMAFSVFLLLTPISVSASEVSTYSPSIEDGIMPYYIDTVNKILNNGETIYFINNANGKPFTLYKGSKVMPLVTLGNGGANFLQVGAINVKTGAIWNIFKIVNVNVGETIGIGGIVPETGEYKFFITNYDFNPAPIISLELTNWN